ncbi:MAG: metal dependent phosphohydrolase [Jatrophihabitans sp.]|nr:metal dependent phosphohydrolase [Jatrophihabitans sp.]
MAAEATRLCDCLGIDPGLVLSAAWLHDIGYAPTVADTGFHPLDGARYLRAHHWDDEVCRLVAHHTDAVHQAPTEDVGDQLASDFAEVDGSGRDVLWTADATTGPNGERLTLDERIAEISERYGRDHPVTLCMIGSRDVLAAAIDRVGAACR